MANQPTFIATKARHFWVALWLVLLTLQSGALFAQENVGTVVDISGPLLARKLNGVVKVLTQKSTVDQGDVLESEKSTYARIKFIDDSEITLKPNTQFKIESFSYDSGKPDNDSSVFSLIKGGLRSITGLLGKRNKEKYKLNTPAATIGIRGTTYIAEYIPPNTQAVAQNSGPGLNPNKNPGLYVEVLDGTINLKNAGGSQDYTAGQFGYVADFNDPPVILPNDPGLQFTPPPSFSLYIDENGQQRSVNPEDLYCIVR